MTVKQKEKLGTIGMFATAAIWGYSFVAIKIMVTDIPPFYLVAFRMLTAAIILSFVFLKKIKTINKKDILISIPIGLALFFGFALQTYSLRFIAASKTAFYTGAYVIFIPFFVWIIYKKRPRMTAFVAASITVIGLGFLTFHDFGSIELGDIVAISCSIMFAVHLILIDNAVSKISGVKLAVLQMYIAGIVSLILGVFTSKMPKLYSLSTDIVISFLYLAVGATALAYLLQNVCQKFVSANKTSLILSLESFLGALCGILFLNEPLTFNIAIGGICIILAIGLCEIGNNSKNIQTDNSR